MKIFLLMFAGALGTLTRYGLTLLIGNWSARNAPLFGAAQFPLATLLVNVAGCFLMGVLVALYFKSAVSLDARLVLGVGFLGSFTTFSAFELEAQELLVENLWPAAVTYITANLLGGLVAIWLGRALVLRVLMPAA